MNDEKSNQSINKVVVLGGGTAGWITANHLACKLRPKNNQNIQIILVESPNIPTVGVGEGTVPAMRNTLREFGISESDFIRECDATFKQSIKFIDWTFNPSDKQNHSIQDNTYHHLFDYPFLTQDNLFNYWLSQSQVTNKNFADTVSYQGRLADLGLAPKTITDKEFTGDLGYAYHLDAGKFTALLKRNAIEKLGVEHITADVKNVASDSDGYITELECEQTNSIKGDFFIDCSGFTSKILGQHYEVPFVDKSDCLFVDNAVVMQVPYPDENTPIACNTIATAQEAGWIWDIGLSARKGIGYVYSSDHIEHDEAERVLRNYAGSAASKVSSRRIPMKVGYRNQFWIKNCVAIGLSQGFVEPLEATGLLVFDVTAKMLADSFPVNRASFKVLEKRFNKTMTYTWERVIDFIKLHYYLSQRDDSDFWIRNRDPSTVSDELLEKIELWKNQPPTNYDFFTKHEIFNLDNYLYVLYGMMFKTKICTSGYLHQSSENIPAIQAKLEQRFEYLKQRLVPHRTLIEQIKKHGLQKI